VVLTAIAIWLHLDVRTVGDMGKLPDSLPVFLVPDIPLNLDTLLIILPYSAGLAVVGLLESMMTATIVDDMTDTPSKNRECKAQGIANICTSFIGGMAGCAMIGQSVINVKWRWAVCPPSLPVWSCCVWWSSSGTWSRKSLWPRWSP
jgi:SulP family sulfate permease